MSYHLVTPELEAELAREPSSWLVLDAHPEFRGYWRVNGLTDDFKFDLDEALGPYRAVAPSELESFRLSCDAQGYKIAFFDDPMTIMDAYQGLNEPPDVMVHSTLPNTVNGLLPYQVQGFNFFKDARAGVARWDTGTGKTVLASALVKHHEFDLCLFVVKKHNKENTVRKLKASVGVESIRIRGPKAQRERYYADIAARLANGERKIVVVMNYEQFSDFVEWKRRETGEIAPSGLTTWGEAFFPNRDLLCIWDEMPMKLKTRTTRRYMAICHCLYDTYAPKVNWKKKRLRELRQYMLSATPVENDPEDWFNCVRLLDPSIYGSVPTFRDEYVASWSSFDENKPEDWHLLDRMALKSAHIVHQVDKTDPDIAAVFPKVISEPVYIDWNDEAASLYKALEKLAKTLKADEEEESLHILSLINLFQMICDAPTMILDSAAHRELYESALEAWEAIGGDWTTKPDPSGSGAALEFVRAIESQITNKNHAKVETLRGLITEVHPNDKICVFTRWNEAIMPVLEECLEEWGVNYVRFNGSERQKQAAQDAFQTDPDIQVFLSSDQGSDSIDLDAGSVCIHFDLPWKWTTYIQRENRIHRATSRFPTVWYYTLLMADSIEDRILEIIMRKQGYHDSLFAPTAGASASARLTKEDFLYILTGEYQ